MTDESETLAVLDKRWRTACKVVFKEDVGPLSDYYKWLDELIDKNRHEKSCISGKDVTIAIKEYHKDAKFIGFGEVDFNKEYPPLSINEIKDIDSLISAIRDRVCYCGNIIIGNCGHVEKSANISDSFFVYDSAQYGDSKYLFKCTVGRICEDCFGTHGPGESQFCIRCTQTYRDRRCFEAWMCQNCSDCYYSFNLDNCAECLFCFNLRSKRHCIGNLQLEPKKYEQLKAKLLAEMAGKLRREKKLPSLIDIVAKARLEKPEIPPQPDWRDNESGKEEVEREFTKTAKLVLGTELSGIDGYKKWLLSHTHTMIELKSAASGKKILHLPYTIAIPALPKDRLLTIEEAIWWGEHAKMPPEEVEKLTLENAHDKLGRIAYFAAEFCEGDNKNITDCAIMIDNSYCYLTSAMVYSKYCACGMWPRSSEHCFGFDTLWDCSFCINCYHSVKLTRCFEVDSCRSCSGCYYCHNCENLTDCMFCFNTKNLRYAIGNVEVGREAYMRIKKLVLGEIGKKLEKNRSLEFDIYNIGARAKE
ncbi:MAG: hypothetical protein NT157_04335 [Candidatus Micrarchaeota archaeon]|nr:hypothetical protein [Candidatus Micrarchaeota archaeon]